MVAPQRLSDESALQVADPRRAQVPALSKQLTSLHQVDIIPQYCVPAGAYEAMSSISTHAPAADAASATTASDRIIVEQSFSCCPKSKQRAGRASSAKSRLRMPLLGCSARMPTDGSRWRAGSLKRLLVVAFAPRLRQCDVKCAVRVVLLLLQLVLTH